MRPRLSSLRLWPARENEIVDELSQHLDDRWRELVAGGTAEDKATRLALAGFREGNLLANAACGAGRRHSAGECAACQLTVGLSNATGWRARRDSNAGPPA